jgi:cytidylate kinase
MPGVTISAAYGCGGAVVAPAVAEQLGMPLLDRAISSAVASQLHVTLQEAEGAELKRSLVGRFFSVLAPLAGGVLGAGTDAAPPDADLGWDDADTFREQAERLMKEAISSGAVILGRGGTAALRNEPGVLRVRLFGDVERRIAQGAIVEGVDESTARARQPEVDAARRLYFRKLYHDDIDQLTYYHLQLDSTVLPLATCADIIVTAYRALVPPGGDTPSPR